ncbi:MAG: TIGR02678 family protein [Actinomycetota bacterium]|nr:TIGR02678 family protein [Actinomycetota bacterium]
MSNLSNQLAITEREEVARGIRLLLASPLISSRAAADWFDLVRRRREPIRRWFDYFCGWTLIVEPRLGYARLAKVAAATDPSRPARRTRSGRAPFDRRRYVLLCLVAAELLAVPVTTIGLLADRISRASAVDPVVTGFDSASRAERMAFVDVLRLLESYGVIEVVDGATDSFVDTAAAKVLYRVDATLLLRLLAAPVGPSQLAVPADEVPLRFEELLGLVTQERRYGRTADDGSDAVPASPTQRNLWLRHSVFRRLADDPVLYLDDLSVQERAYITSPTGRRLLREAADQGGFILEDRADGMMFVDPDAIATDSRFPDDASTAKVAALLLLDRLREPSATEQLELAAAGLLARFPRWARRYRENDGPQQLVCDALAVLTGFGLARVADGLVYPLPAAARYAVGAARSTDPYAEERLS